MPAPTPEVIVEAFASSAGPSYINDPIPVAPSGTNAASFHDGFPPVTMTPVGSGGQDFLGQDLNGILKMITAYLAALTGGQFWTFNSTWASANGGYAIGAIVELAFTNGGAYGFWVSTVNDNVNNPDTTAANSSGWIPMGCAGITSLNGQTGGINTLTAPQAAAPTIIIAGVLTSNLQVVLPRWVQGWTIINKTTGSFSVTVKTNVGTGVAIPQTSVPTAVFGDGTNFYLI